MKDNEIKSKYVNTMRSIETPIIEIVDIQERHSKRNINGFVVVACILAMMLIFTSLPSHEIGLVVYAADGSYKALADGPVQLVMDMDTSEEFVSMYEEYGQLTFPFVIGCEDEKVQEISYSIEGEETYYDIYHMKKNKVWFATQETVSWKETYETTDGRWDFPYIYIAYGPTGAERATVYRYRGSTYSVEKNDMAVNLKLVIECEKDEDGYVVEDVVIDVVLHYEDGLKKETQLILQQVVSEEPNYVTMSIKQK